MPTRFRFATTNHPRRTLQQITTSESVLRGYPDNAAIEREIRGFAASPFVEVDVPLRTRRGNPIYRIVVDLDLDTTRSARTRTSVPTASTLMVAAPHAKDEREGVVAVLGDVHDSLRFPSTLEARRYVVVLGGFDDRADVEAARTRNSEGLLVGLHTTLADVLGDDAMKHAAMNIAAWDHIARNAITRNQDVSTHGGIGFEPASEPPTDRSSREWQVYRRAAMEEAEHVKRTNGRFAAYFLGHSSVVGFRTRLHTLDDRFAAFWSTTLAPAMGESIGEVPIDLSVPPRLNDHHGVFHPYRLKGLPLAAEVKASEHELLEHVCGEHGITVPVSVNVEVATTTFQRRTSPSASSPPGMSPTFAGSLLTQGAERLWSTMFRLSRVAVKVQEHLGEHDDVLTPLLALDRSLRQWGIDHEPVAPRRQHVGEAALEAGTTRASAAIRAANGIVLAMAALMAHTKNESCRRVVAEDIHDVLRLRHDMEQVIDAFYDRSQRPLQRLVAVQRASLESAIQLQQGVRMPLGLSPNVERSSRRSSLSRAVSFQHDLGS